MGSSVHFGAFRSLVFFALILFLLLRSGSAAHAQHTPSEVLLVYNANSQISVAVAKDYAAKRHITHIVAVACQDSSVSPDNETIALAEYLRQIADPISRFLAKQSGINFIVLTKGIPIRIRGGITGEASQGIPQPSLDSYLAAMDYPNLPGTVKASLAGSGWDG